MIRRPPRSTHRAAEKGLRPCHAGLHAYWRRDRLVKGIGHCGCGGEAEVPSMFPKNGSAGEAEQPNHPLVCMCGLCADPFLENLLNYWHDVLQHLLVLES